MTHYLSLFASASLRAASTYHDQGSDDDRIYKLFLIKFILKYIAKFKINLICESQISIVRT